MLLEAGNMKLGREGVIWGFGIPSVRTCPGRTGTCEAHCYARRAEEYRVTLLRKLERNYRLTLRPDFPEAIGHELRLVEAPVVRVHTFGDVYSPCYAEKWLKVFQAHRETRFYSYTRSYRVKAIRDVLERWARRRNVRLWYSCDRETGIPDRVPRRVRLAWLQTAEGEEPPSGASHLVFRVRRLRKVPQRRIALALVCPTENGLTGHRTDCARCGVCWQPEEGPVARALEVA